MVRLLVDAEELWINYLLSRDEVTDLVGTRIGTRIPVSPTTPFIRLFRRGGPIVIEGHIDAARLQIEAFHDEEERAEAQLVAATVQAVMYEGRGSHETGVVCDVKTLLGLMWSPDPETKRARFIQEFETQIHPNPTP